MKIIDLKGKVSKNKYDFILKIGRFADEFGVNAYIIGGFVRDILLKKKDADIDITVEGNGIKFAEFVAKKFNLPYKCFEKFKTGKIFFKNGKTLDIASARSEKYERPGALPDVDLSVLKQDLFRRDFTINAMAIQINKKNFGEFFDYFNGLCDLKNKIIRVLHNKSFIDDSTRILRAIRFAGRFGFKIEKNTIKLLKQALKKNIFNTVSAERIRNEIFLILKEKKTFEILKKGEKFGVFKLLNKNLKFKKFLKKFFEKTADSTLRFLFFIYNLNKKQAILFAEKLKLDNDLKKIIIEVKTKEKIILNFLKNKTIDELKLYKLLKKADEKVIDYFILLCNNKKLKDFIKKIKNVKIYLTGKDLINYGLKEGKQIGKILDIIRFEKIIGKIKNKKQELKRLKDFL